MMILNTIDWAEELKKLRKKYRWLMLFLLFGIPVIIHLLYKWKTGYSILEGEWDAGAMLAFYGAILGGSIGGIGTLGAVLITTKETRDIQKRNEEQLAESRAEKTKDDRKMFAYSVTEDVAKFLANLALYKDGSTKIKECQERINEMNEKLADVRKLMAENRPKINDPKSKMAMPYLENAEKGFVEAIRVERNNIRDYANSKAPALERATVLNIKLCEINEAEKLMEKVVAMLAMSEDETITFEDFMNETNTTMDIAADFVNKYING